MTNTFTREIEFTDAKPFDGEGYEVEKRRFRLGGWFLAIGLVATTGFVAYEALAASQSPATLTDSSFDQAERQRQLRLSAGTGTNLDWSSELAETQRMLRFQPTDESFDRAERQRQLGLDPGNEPDQSSEAAEQQRMERLRGKG